MFYVSGITGDQIMSKITMLLKQNYVQIDTNREENKCEELTYCIPLASIKIKKNYLSNNTKSIRNNIFRT